ncbi:agmatine deiminase [Marinobacter mobilis]|uniref:Agmatine deiminase n=2 Tax=Marinobacter mobilis TaxID=488533 RepID=A0A1H2UN81_9GAMM|nr:agmatine deiminase family protein [Marinobacter mobilis]SDW57547.1 agmatine deiminase [Marinobacter mobilis]
MPAEWETQKAVMLTWPHAGTDWRDILGEVEPVFLDIAKAVLQFENLVVSCEDANKVNALSALFETYIQDNNLPHSVRVLQAPADDTWARDHGPISVRTPTGLSLLDFAFNAWGGKFAYEKDNRINGKLAEAGAFGDLPMRAIDLVLEGGSIESDGQGTLLTTSECLLTPTRNPELDRTAIEAALSELLGARHFLWLNHGYLAGDDTDSHIDTLARLCAADTICYVACPDETDEHYHALKAMEEELRNFHQPDGQPYKLTPLPWPDAIHDDDGERLPATYANFLIINGAVLLPVYGVAQDGEAIETLASLFPDRKIVPIQCRPLIKQHGSLHCVTMQIPAE